MKEQREIYDLTLPALKEYLRSIGESAFRATQIFEWLYVKNVSCWDVCSNLSKSLRVRLSDDYCISTLRLEHAATSKKGDSVKLLFKTSDGCFVETVLIFSYARVTVCLSSQIGCKYGCAFCASCKEGFVRDLRVSEILDQFLAAERFCKQKISNVVFMGMGEPLDNYEAVVQSIRRITSAKAIGLSARRVTLSTVGLVPALKKLADEKLTQIKLSISIHAAIDSKRKMIMPVAKKYSLAQLQKVLQVISGRFTRTFTLEYILIKKFNDSDKDVRALASFAKELRAKVNVIGYNKIEGVSYVVPTNADMDAFREKLEKAHVPVTVRYSAGSDITAACGQLRLKSHKP